MTSSKGTVAGIASVGSPGGGPAGAGVVLVVGASGALGQSICERLAADGSDLCLAWRSNAAAVQQLAGRLPPAVRVSIERMDLADPATIARVADALQAAGRPVSCVVFAAGAHIEQPWVADVPDAAWRSVVETELIGFANLARCFIPVFRAQGGGAFVCITTFANFACTVGDALSSVPKAGVESLVRSIALEEGRHGIRANCVAPGIINAGLGAEFQRDHYTPQAWDRVRKSVPMRRFGEAAEVAEAVAFLASGRASYVTGNTLIVDGGMHL